MEHEQDIKQQTGGDWRFFGVHAVAYMRPLQDGIGIFSADGVMLDLAQDMESARQVLSDRRLQPVAVH